MKYFITLLSFLLILFLFNYCNGNEFPNPKEESIYLNEPTLSFGNCDKSTRTVTVQIGRASCRERV